MCPIGVLIEDYEYVQVNQQERHALQHARGDGQRRAGGIDNGLGAGSARGAESPRRSRPLGGLSTNAPRPRLRASAFNEPQPTRTARGTLALEACSRRAEAVLMPINRSTHTHTQIRAHRL